MSPMVSAKHHALNIARKNFLSEVEMIETYLVQIQS